MTTADTIINLRAPKELRDLVDRAARAQSKNRTEFVLEAIGDRAREVLLDRTLFELDAKQWARFNELLDQPPSPKFQALLKRQTPWDER